MQTRANPNSGGRRRRCHCHNSASPGGQPEVEPNVAAMSTRFSLHEGRRGVRWWWCGWAFVLHLYLLGLVLLQVGLATCKPITSGLEAHEGLLVDLINEQQRDFLAQLGPADKQATQPAGHMDSGSKWVPVITINQPQATSSIAAKNESLVRLESRDSSSKEAHSKCNQQTREGSLSGAESRAIQSRGRPGSASASKRAQQDNDEDDDDEDGTNEDRDDSGGDQGFASGSTKKTANSPNKSTTSDLLDARASVPLESSLVPPPLMRGDEDEQPQSSEPGGDEEEPEQETAAAAGASDGQESAAGASDGQESAADAQNESASGLTPEAEAAERRELEAAEASEAEAANKSALAEQQQQQREIIKAQAQNEAEAIRQQQNALLKQQQLQHQILMRRDQELLEGDARAQRKRHKTKWDRQQVGQPNRRYADDGEHRSESSQAEKSRPRAQQQNPDRQQVRRKQTDSRRFDIESSDNRAFRANQEAYPHSGSDTQFSDQPDGRIVDRGSAPNTKLNGKQTRRNSQHKNRSSGDAHYGSHPARFEPVIAASSVNKQVLIGSHIDSKNLTNSTDLVAAAQNYHDSGLHYGLFDTLHGGLEGLYFDSGHYKKKSGGYHQYAESHKKAQFDSGFKRGNQKFTISGHSSQHKGHAKGHVKWKGKKGKGDHHWEYKHKNKKHYGSGGHGFGGGGHYYF